MSPYKSINCLALARALFFGIIGVVVVSCGGGSTTTTPVNNPPTVTLLFPLQDLSFGIGTAISLIADASDADSNLDHVNFFVDNVLIGQSSTPPFNVSWTVSGSGTRQISAISVDDEGLESDSDSASIQVVGSTSTLPTIAIVNPTEGDIFADSADITFTMNASDADGSVIQVQLFADSSLIGSDTFPVYQVTWSNASSGTHIIVAVAIDDDGNQSASTPIEISVGGVEDVQMGTPGVCYGNPEFTRDNQYMVWFERGAGITPDGRGVVRMWHCAIDPDTGDFDPPDCKGFNGFDSTFYTRAYAGQDVNGPLYVGTDENDDFVIVRPTSATTGQVQVIGGLPDVERRAIYPSVLPNQNKVYVWWLKSHGTTIAPPNAEWVELRYIDTDDPENEIVIEHQENTDVLVPMDVTFPRWSFNEPIITYGSLDSNNHVQIYEYDVSQSSPVLTQITDDVRAKTGPYPFVYNNRRYIIAGTNFGGRTILYEESDTSSIYDLVDSFDIPASESFANQCSVTSPETFIFDGHQLVGLQLSDCATPDSVFPFFTEPGQIWAAELFTGNTQARRISDDNIEIKLEPEPVIGTNKSWVYYTSYPEGFDQTNACYEIRRATVPSF